MTPTIAAVLTVTITTTIDIDDQQLDQYVEDKNTHYLFVSRPSGCKQSQ